MYFAVLGKNPEISMAELEFAQIKEITYPKKGIIIFDTKYPGLLAQLWGVIKVGTVVKEKDLQELLKDVKIIWIKEEANGKHLKRTIGIRRYKIVDLFHTDREIKNKGKEIINLENGLYGIVEQYQNIELYEEIDFWKPGRSMKMGMMPAKLTHMMINIWLKYTDADCTMYDPFVGSGTTGFLANYLGYNFIGSDIDMQYIEVNAPWREKTKFYDPKASIEVFQHDITKPLKAPLIKGEVKGDLLIVSEWWLGPIVHKTTSEQNIDKFQNQVWNLYKSFLDRISELKKSNWSIVAVYTIPWYVNTTNILEEKLTEYWTKIWLELQSIPEIYSREWQQIGRKILITT